MEDSQFVPNPLFQCNYFYASRELLPMTATDCWSRRRWRRDETRRDETRRDATRRRHRVCRSGGEANIGFIEERRETAGGTWAGSSLHTRSRELQLSRIEDRSGKRDEWEKVGELARDGRGWNKDRCHWQHLGELETDKRKLTRDWNTWLS